MSVNVEDAPGRLAHQFFRCVPVKTIEWHGDWSDWDEEHQDKVLCHTVHHPHNQLFPPPHSYQQAFFKHIIMQLERLCVEICDGLYETYTELISKQHDASGYKTYYMMTREGSCHSISLRESTNLISGGTTGLVTWQAAQNLAEWAMENSSLFQDRRVLELGSGLGFSGLVISAHCSPRHYTFSDCHHLVLQQLQHNVLINAPQTSDSGPWAGRACTLCHRDASAKERAANLSTLCEEKAWTEEPFSHDAELTKWKLAQNSRMDILQLDWEEVEKRQLEFIGQETDIVIAADVVYDDSIIPALVRVMCGLLSCSNPPDIYIASTVRNEDTAKQFTEALEVAGMCARPVEPPELQIFQYDRSTPVRIMNIQQTAPR